MSYLKHKNHTQHQDEYININTIFKLAYIIHTDFNKRMTTTCSAYFTYNASKKRDQNRIISMCFGKKNKIKDKSHNCQVSHHGFFLASASLHYLLCKIRFSIRNCIPLGSENFRSFLDLQAYTYQQSFEQSLAAIEFQGEVGLFALFCCFFFFLKRHTSTYHRLLFTFIIFITLLLIMGKMFKNKLTFLHQTLSFQSAAK